MSWEEGVVGEKVTPSAAARRRLPPPARVPFSSPVAVLVVVVVLSQEKSGRSTNFAFSFSIMPSSFTAVKIVMRAFTRPDSSVASALRNTSVKFATNAFIPGRCFAMVSLIFFSFTTSCIAASILSCCPCITRVWRNSTASRFRSFKDANVNGRGVRSTSSGSDVVEDIKSTAARRPSVLFSSVHTTDTGAKGVIPVVAAPDAVLVAEFVATAPVSGTGAARDPTNVLLIAPPTCSASLKVKNVDCFHVSSAGNALKTPRFAPPPPAIS